MKRRELTESPKPSRYRCPQIIMEMYTQPERDSFLRHLFEKVKGDVHSVAHMFEIGEELGFTKQKTILIVQYLEGEGLVDQPGVRESVRLTHQGLKVVHALLSKPEQLTQYFSQKERRMAGIRKNSPRESTPPSVSPQQGIQLLRRQRERGDNLLGNRPLKKADYDAWLNTTREFLVKAFGSNSINVHSFTGAGQSTSVRLNPTEEELENGRIKTLSAKLVMISSLVEQLETEIELNSSQVSSKTETSIGNSVFLVHGHNEGVREKVARFLEHLDLRVIIFHEQPDRGRTIIEKFEDYSKDTGFTVVLLTGDDLGGPKEKDPGTYQLRARQNVILELGFFLGAFGRDRVCALYEEGIDIPSDYQGVLFTKLDSDWKLKLARELKAAGLPVDLNRALS